MDLKPLPWSNVKFWSCIRCGDCCKLAVQLTTREWLDLTRRYGYAIIDQEVGGFYLRKTIDDTCPFLLRSPVGLLCALQQTKPLACKLWPFRVLTEPKYGQPSEACFNYRNRRFYVYVMPNCPGISWGRPAEWFVEKTLPEFIDIRIGLQEKQYLSTSRFHFQP